MTRARSRHGSKDSRSRTAALVAAGSLCAAWAAACSTARPLEPLAVGQWAAEASIPMLWVGNPEFDFPVGNVTVGARYGLGREHELRFRLHPAALAAAGIVGLEAGGVWHVRPARGWLPALHLTGDLSLFTHPASYDCASCDVVRGAVDVALIAHLEPLAWLWPYAVFDSPVILADAAWVPSAILGLQLRPGQAWEISLETGWAGFTYDASRLTQPYISPWGRGAVWTALAVAYRFGEPAAAEVEP